MSDRRIARDLLIYVLNSLAAALAAPLLPAAAAQPRAAAARPLAADVADDAAAAAAAAADAAAAAAAAAAAHPIFSPHPLSSPRPPAPPSRLAAAPSTRPEPPRVHAPGRPQTPLRAPRCPHSSLQRAQHRRGARPGRAQRSRCRGGPCGSLARYLCMPHALPASITSMHGKNSEGAHFVTAHGDMQWTWDLAQSVLYSILS